MMRAWAYSASIITLRMIQIIAVEMIGSISDSNRMLHYEQIDSVSGLAAATYPNCAADPTGWPVARMDFGGTGVAEIMVASQGTFACAGRLLSSCTQVVLSFIFISHLRKLSVEL
jgi:hypothetical protein